MPEFVWVIDNGMQSFKKIYSVITKLNRFFCPPLFRKRTITDHPSMTIVVYHGHKTTSQQQQLGNGASICLIVCPFTVVP